MNKEKSYHKCLLETAWEYDPFEFEWLHPKQVNDSLYRIEKSTIHKTIAGKGVVGQCIQRHKKRKSRK